MKTSRIRVNIIHKLRESGFKVSSSAGYIGLARTIGASPKNKKQAKAALAAYFNGGRGDFRADRARAPTKPIQKDVVGDKFLESYEWRKLRMQALKKYGPVCMCCGATPKHGARMNVDHIKPRRSHPELALTLANLQILCDACNHGKGNWDMTDWRDSEADQLNLPKEARNHMRDILLN